MEKAALLLAYRLLVKEVCKWPGTPEFRRKLISNLADIHRMPVKNPAEMRKLGESAFNYLKSVRPQSLDDLRTYMRPHELSKVSLRPSPPAG